MTSAAASSPFDFSQRTSAQSPRRRVPRGVKRALLIATLSIVAAVAFVISVNLYMAFAVRGQMTTVANAQHAQAAIVLGALVNADGSMSPMLADRVKRGAELYKAGKVARVIVSGDHHTWSYDEPGTMRKA